MPLALLALQFAALSCAALALALPGYVFVVLVWSSLRTLGAGLAETGAAACLRAGALARARLQGGARVGRPGRRSRAHLTAGHAARARPA